MYKIDHQELPVLEKNIAKELLRLIIHPTEFLECHEEKCWVVFCSKGKEAILEHLDIGTIKDYPIKVSECYKEDFTVKEIHDLFDKIKESQNRLLSYVALNPTKNN